MVKILLGGCPANLLLWPGMPCPDTRINDYFTRSSIRYFAPLCTLFCRALHGVGQCSVDVRAILQGHCPNIQTFCGINLREASGKIKSKQQVRKILHKDYVARGGAMELGLWSKRYWRGKNTWMQCHQIHQWTGCTEYRLNEEEEHTEAEQRRH